MKTDDEKLVHAMSHEFYMLSSSYKTFLITIIENKKSDNSDLKITLYNSYAQTILHLYEFMKACVARTKSKSQSEKKEVVESHITHHAVRVTKGMEGGPNKADCEKFSEDLRKARNKIIGHVDKGRFDLFPLTDFYRSYHVLLHRLIIDTESSWKTESNEIANHPSILDFSEMLTFGQAEWK